MDIASQAARGYRTAQRQTESARGVEAKLFAEVTAALVGAHRAGREGFKDMAAALHNNRLLWDALLIDLSAEGNRLPRGSTGQWIDVNMVDPRTHQAHIGYAHELAANTTVAIDFTHIEGRNEKRQLSINPIVDGRRLLADDFERVFGDPNYLGDVRILSGINKSRYDALTFLFRRRLPRATLQAHYTLSGAYSYGGSTGNRSGAGRPQQWDQPFAEGEWGPNGPDMAS